MNSKDKVPPHCDHETCQIRRPHCHICDNGSCGLDLPHCHVCLHDEETKPTDEPIARRPSLEGTRNDTQPSSIKHQAEFFQQMRTRPSSARRSSTPTLEDDVTPEVAYHSAQWQPSYAVGGGTDLTKTLRPTGHRTFSWGGPGTSITIPSPDGSRSSSAPASRGEDYPSRPPIPHVQSNRMREVLRRRFDERDPSAYGSERGISTAPLRTPPPFGSPSLRASPIGSSPITSSPISSPAAEKTESGADNGRGRRPGMVRGLSTGTFKGIKKALDKAK